MSKTLAEKILSLASGVDAYKGDIVVANVDFAMAQDGTAPLAIEAFRSMGVEKVWDPSRIALVIDHNAPSPSEGVSKLHKMMRDWATSQGVKLYDVGEGVCHQLMMEKGHAKPGKVVLGADSHTCTYGALGALATGIGSTEMAAVFACGQLWMRVPETFLVVVEGKLPEGVYAKDLVLTVIGKVGADGATYMAVEYTGSTVKELSLDSRMTLCNMAVEMGGKTGLVAPDEKVVGFLKEREITEGYELLASDEDAEFSEKLEIDAGNLVPVVACPHSVDNVKPIEKVEGTPVNQVFIGTCTNGRIEDLRIAGRVMKDRKVKVRTIIVPASREVYLKALREGLIEAFIKAGATVCNPGCGPCVGTHQGIPSPGDVVVSTANRNFKGRMGCDEAEIYLASPHTAALAAVTGEISDPREEKS
ncbi:MAG: 3-isopropylmalate dehydratase large subunit [Candidatus Jordarchaeales archaeon]|nr:3-isopropylmalate dehydratase large subunit [Candidatus Jordarchaeia archaeon]